MRSIPHMKGYQLGVISLALSCIMLTAANAQRLTALESITLANGDVELRYHFDKNIVAPKSFYLKEKDLLVVDFSSTGFNQVLKSRTINNNVVKDINNLYANQKVRSTVQLKSNTTYSINNTANEVVVILSSNNPYSVNQESWDNTVQSNIANVEVQQPTTKDVGFYRNSQGAGVVELFLPNDKAQVQLVDEQTRGLTLSVPGSAWSAAQIRRIEVTDFATPVSALEVVNNNGIASLKIRTQSNYEYSSQQIGSKYQLIVKPKKQVVETSKSALGDKDIFTGDLISINFQDIDVRAILQIIADFTGLNIVVSDSVNSRITIRLQNVPWDQALDVVLRSKGLVKQQSGNVVYIMPASEARTLDPDLITEIIQINNAKAPEIAEVLSSTKNNIDDNRRNQSTGISQHGMLTVDPNQNLLIVRDTPEQMKIIRELITRLDRPLRQVVIKAQIIATTDDFSREIGMKWGIGAGNKGKWGQNGGLNPGSKDSDKPGFNMTRPGWNEGDKQNIWGGGAFTGQAAGFGLSILRSSFNAQLELTAMQVDGKGEVLSSPTLMTTDRQEAYINQGSQIPYQSGSPNEGYTTEFVDALMELKVTPNITPDDNIIMDIQIKKDEVGPPIVSSTDGEGGSNSQPSLKKHEVKTQAIVRDGETVVIGGIYTVETGQTISKVPFLGDLPFIGNLFKNTTNRSNKAELVIFLTPNIVK